MKENIEERERERDRKNKRERERVSGEEIDIQAGWSGKPRRAGALSFPSCFMFSEMVAMISLLWVN